MRVFGAKKRPASAYSQNCQQETLLLQEALSFLVLLQFLQS
jgi:hypothetical protein